MPPRAGPYATFPWNRGIRRIRKIFLKPKAHLHTRSSKNFYLTEPPFCGIIKVSGFFCSRISLVLAKYNLHQKFNFFFDIKSTKKEPAALRQALLAAYIPQGLAELRYPHSRNLLLALLDERDLVGLAVNFKSELTLRIRDLHGPIRLSHAIRELINNCTLRIIGLTSAGLALLGLRSFFNCSLIQIALLRKVTINCYLIRNLLTACIPEDLRRNNYCLLVTVLIDEGVLEISRIHILLFLIESLLTPQWGGP